MDLAAAQVLGAHHLAGGRLHERRAAQEDGALVLHDDRLVAHGGHVRAARGAGAHHHGDLRDARRREVRLVVEDAPEVFLVGEDLVLQGQEGAAGVDEVDAGQAVLRGDLLRAQVLLHRERVVRAALHRRVVRDDHHFAALDAADAGDDAGGRGLVAVEPVGGELRELEEGRAGIEQGAHALAGQELAARRVLLLRLGAAADGDARHRLAQVRGERRVVLAVGAEGLRAGVEPCLQLRHGEAVVIRRGARAMSMRWISLVPS